MNFNNFDINPQAMAVMAYLGQYGGIEASFSAERGYVAEVKAAPWYNGRERGIVFYMRNEDQSKQLNIAIYEHRNSDMICAIVWEQVTYLNPPSLATIPEDVFKDKYDYTESWSYGRALDAAKFVMEQFEQFWKEN